VAGRLGLRHEHSILGIAEINHAASSYLYPRHSARPGFQSISTVQLPLSHPQFSQPFLFEVTRTFHSLALRHIHHIPTCVIDKTLAVRKLKFIMHSRGSNNGQYQACLAPLDWLLVYGENVTPCPPGLPSSLSHRHKPNPHFAIFSHCRISAKPFLSSIFHATTRF